MVIHGNNNHNTIMITMLGLVIVVTYVEQRLTVRPNTAGKKELYGSNPCFYI